jgi:hypothetical protein
MTLALISSSEAIRRRFGAAAREVFAALREAGDRLSTDSAPARLVFPDDEASMRPLGLPAADLGSWHSVEAALQRVRGALGDRPTALLILGGDSIIPFCRPDNSIDWCCDQDREVLTDHPYGLALAGDAGSAERWKGVGRVPDPEPPDAAVFMRCLANVARPRPWGRWGSLAVADPAWEETTWRILLEVAGSNVAVRRAPPWTAHDPEWARGDATLLYFNLHGFNNAAAWRGFRNETGLWTDVLSPSQVVPSRAEGTVVVAENCYGAVVNDRSAAQSMALAFLNAGARAFVGATGLAYGTYSPNRCSLLTGADAFSEALLRGMYAGDTLGGALLEAQKPPTQNSTIEEKTRQQFVLYGNPLARL